MKLGTLKKGSTAVAAAMAAARSARNRASRAAHTGAAEERASARRYKQARAREDRDRERAMNRRIRVTVQDGERPRTRGRTPRALFYRLGNQAIGSRLLTGGGASTGTRSIHFAVTARGFASKSGRAWRDGEGERAAQYITREDALEGGEAGWWSNIAVDRNELVAFFRAGELVEKHDRANANVYMSEIIALPASLTARQRRRVVRRYCQYFDRRGIAYAVGMHKPDPAGDGRNFHCHIIYSLRPAARLAAYDWSFAVSKLSDVNTPDGITLRRKLAVDAINLTLKAAGSAQRYTQLSNRARGLGYPAPKRGQRQTWVLRRLIDAQARCDNLNRMRERIAVLQRGLAIIATADGMRATASDCLRAAQGFLNTQMIAHNARMARCRIVAIARLGEANVRERVRTLAVAVDVAKPVVAGALRSAQAKSQSLLLLDQRLAAAQARSAARERRRKRLAEIAARVAEPLPDLVPASHTALERVVERWRHIAVDRHLQDTAAATIKARTISLLYETKVAISPSTNARLEGAAGRIVERQRIGAMRTHLTEAMASLPDLRRVADVARDRLMGATERHLEGLLSKEPVVPVSLGIVPPAATATPSDASIGSASVIDPALSVVSKPVSGPLKHPVLSSPDHAAEPQKRLAEMDAGQAEREAARQAKAAKMAVPEPSRTASLDKVASPKADRPQRRVPPIRSKGPEDVTAPPPGSGRAGPER